jgi:hypothetical protein
MTGASGRPYAFAPAGNETKQKSNRVQLGFKVPFRIGVHIFHDIFRKLFAGESGASGTTEIKS